SRECDRLQLGTGIGGGHVSAVGCQGRRAHSHSKPQSVRGIPYWISHGTFNDVRARLVRIDVFWKNSWRILRVSIRRELVPVAATRPVGWDRHFHPARFLGFLALPSLSFGAVTCVRSFASFRVGPWSCWVGPAPAVRP